VAEVFEVTAATSVSTVTLTLGATQWYQCRVTDLFIEGIAVDASSRDRTRSLTDLIFDAVRAAVDDSGRAMESIDSIVLSAHDLVDGRSLSSMVTAPAAGAYLRDEIRFGDDGAGALAAAVTRLEAGHNRATIVAAWGRASEHDVQAFSHSLFDPFIEGPVGLDELAVSAMRGQSWLGRFSPEGRLAAHGARRERAARNPRSVAQAGDSSSPPYPLLAGDLPVWGDFAVALVMSTEPAAVRIAGLGQSSDPYHLGDRDLLGMPALTAAVGKALAEAGRTIEEMDVVELDALTAFDEALAVEALGLAPPGSGHDHVACSAAFNPSGGSAAGYCAPAMGLVRVVEAVHQLRGTAGAIQVEGARRALATGSSTIAAQTQTAVVLEVAS
jgi:acetyl-CoA C-acetyltransferase